MDKIKKLFKDISFLDLALTHRSWVNEHKGERASNERLEFLGDAILEFVVSREIYSKFPDKEEGYLTALRASLVNTEALAQVAKTLKIGDSIFLSKGEVDGGGRNNNSLLADTIEAIIGALFIDSGMEKSEQFVLDNILKDLDEKANSPLKDPKSQLQELVQSKGLPAPKYKVTKEEGPDHNKIFVIEALVNGESWGVGNGKSKAEAEQEAARQSLLIKVK